MLCLETLPWELAVCIKGGTLMWHHFGTKFSYIGSFHIAYCLL
jgi:hypothetical protein